MSAPLLLSVVVPTHNRAERLMTTLMALERQTLAAGAFEVIVVLDAVTDDSAARLAGRAWPFALTSAAATGRGAAAARNQGAALARGERLLFLDDDITLDAEALAAHVAGAGAGAGAPGLRVSHLEPALDESGWFGQSVGDWWRGRFAAMGRPGHRFTYQDVMSGALSVGRAEFLALGGFDAGLRCREDYEFGYRAIRAGVGVSYAGAARGLHFDATTPARNLVRAREEGRGDVQMAWRHGRLFPWLKAANMTARRPGAMVLRALVVRAPWAGRGLGRLLAAGLPWLERTGPVRLWGALRSVERALAYQAGVVAEAGGMAELRALADAHRWRPPPELTVDLRGGVAAALALVERERPEAVEVMVGGRSVGRIGAEPGAEPLAARHLRACLADCAEGWAPELAAAALLAAGSAPDPDGLPPVRLAGPGYGLGEVDLAGPRLTFGHGARAFPLRLLLRSGATPLGWVTLAAPPPPGQFWAALGDALLADRGLCLRLLRATALPEPPPADRAAVTVVVCTRDRTERLARCLDALAALEPPAAEVIVVDNAPATEATAVLVAARQAGWPALRYLREDRPGLDWARNAGAQAAGHPVVAYTDDDTAADPAWAGALARALADPAVGFATGPVLPMALGGAAEVYFEEVYGGMGKGFEPGLRSGAALSAHDLLWASALGVGANMAFRRELLLAAGGFDPALDVGTAARGGGDIEIFHRLLARGAVHAYVPEAFVWHEHRADMAALARQLADNGTGFACYLRAAWVGRTVPRAALVRFALRAWVGDWLLARLVRPGWHRRRLVWAEIAGMLAAPHAWRRAGVEAAERRGE